MAGSLLLASILLGPAPAAEPAPEADRDYTGPRQIDEAPKAAKTGGFMVKEDAGGPEPTDPFDGKQGPTPTASDAPAQRDSSGFVVQESSGTPTSAGPTVEEIARRRRAPRVLSSLTEFRADEVASHRKGRVKFTPGLQVRNQIGWISPFTIDRFGNEYDDRAFSTGRIRWNPELKIGKSFKIIGMLDLVNGRWAPGSSDNQLLQDIYEPPPGSIAEGHAPGRDPLDNAYPDFIDPRELFIEYTSLIGLVRLGQMSFLWGQGILANDGNNVDRFGDMKFGDDGPGDIQERLLFATKPFGGPRGKDIVVAVGGDLVFRDERVSLVDGDLGGQGFLVLRYQPEASPGTWIGGYTVYRSQKTADDGDVYADDNTLQAGVADIAGQGTYWIRDDLQLIGAFEGVIIGGKTDIARDDQGTHKVLQGGAAVRGYIGNHEKWLAGFDGGFASGDANPSDRFINNFTFDAGHTVGLVLFQAVNGWRTARTELLATDGALTGVPLNGTQFIPTRGGVTNAIYIHPKARWAFRERFEIWGGPLFAGAPTDIADPYTTNLAGGTPTNTVNGPGSNRYYGTELDLGLRARFGINNFWLQAGLQGGLLLPGKGLANQNGDTDGTIGALWFRTEIRY